MCDLLLIFSKYPVNLTLKTTENAIVEFGLVEVWTRNI